MLIFENEKPEDFKGCYIGEFGGAPKGQNIKLKYPVVHFQHIGDRFLHSILYLIILCDRFLHSILYFHYFLLHKIDIMELY